MTSGMTYGRGAGGTPMSSDTGVCAATTVSFGGSSATMACCSVFISAYVVWPSFRFTCPRRSTAVPGRWPLKSGTRSTSGPALSSTLIRVPRLTRFVVPGERFCHTTKPAGTLSELRVPGATSSVRPRSEQTAFASVTDLPIKFGVGNERPCTKNVKHR